ncbi:MAG: DUF262 domain-containing protein [Bacteroidales bacterium]|nr:DUF262 domain-containing protein [Bacteroidales bacterium]
MKNVETADRIHLGSLIDELKKGKYVIPDFQREFEWDPKDVLDLIQSIFMDYYVGTLLFWKGSKENYKVLSCESTYGFIGKPDPQHIVLDGQQRLTAIYYAFFKPDKPFPGRKNPIAFWININNILEDDFENAFFYDRITYRYQYILDHKEEQYKRHLFPLAEMQDGSWGTSDWIKGYRDYWQDQVEDETGDIEESQKAIKEYQRYADQAKEFREIIEELLNKYYISYIELDRDIDVAKVCDIFTKVNSKGVQLDIFDLLNAMLRPKNILLKNMWRDAEQRLNFTAQKKMKIYILQVMSILEQSYCSSKYLYYLVPESIKTVKKPDSTKEKISLVNTSEEFIDKWNNAVNALEKAIKTLKNPSDFGTIQSNFVPYPSIIPVFASIKTFVESSDFKNKLDIQSKIRKWYWASIFTNRYSSAVESTSAKDFQDLKEWFTDDDAEPEIIAEFISTYKSINLLTDNQKGSAIYNSIINLLVINEARDWASFELPEFDNIDDHHIVPGSVFREEGGPAINSVLNRTLLTSSTNRHIINSRMPNEYLKEMLENNDPKKVYDVLSSHLISKKAVEILLKEPFTKADFDSFLEERQNTIKDAIENILIKEKVEIPIVLQELNSKIEKIELALRELIIEKSGNSYENYKTRTPGHIQDKIKKRINTELKKKPHLSLEDFNSFDKLVQYFDLFEYYDLIVSKMNWSSFEAIFESKEQLQSRFNQLSTLRNAIRHTREVSSIEKLDGEAAIAWFTEILD